MRTTLSIEEDVAQTINRIRERENLSLKEAVNRLLRAGIHAMESKPSKRAYVGPVFNKALRPGVDPQRLNQLVDELEAEEFAQQNDLP